MTEAAKGRTTSFFKWLVTLAIIVAGTAFWGQKAGLDGLWAAVGGAAGLIVVYFAIKDLFVSPLENQIRDLGLQIEALRRQIER